MLRNRFFFDEVPLPGFGRRKVRQKPQVCCFAKKPDWARKEIIRLKALMPDAGCRRISFTFNRIHESSRGVTVGKTFVSDVIRTHHYEILCKRRKLKNRQPRWVPSNRFWGMDLTGKIDSTGTLHNILGVVDHGSRLNLCSVALENKRSFTIFRMVILLIRHHGKPKAIQTDNEPVFTSGLFRKGLKLLGIKLQTTDPGQPWQNGRIERCFGTLKKKLDQWQVDSFQQLEKSLVQFRFWYNHVRPHQYLDGKTPAEAW